jgi:hypothetical protein
LELAVLEQQLLIGIGGFFVMTSQVVNRGQAQLIMGCLLQLVVVRHQVLFIVLLVRDVKHQTHLERTLSGLNTLPFGIIILSQGVVTAGLIDMEIFIVVGFSHHVIVDLDRLSEF